MSSIQKRRDFLKVELAPAAAAGGLLAVDANAQAEDKSYRTDIGTLLIASHPYPSTFGARRIQDRGVAVVYHEHYVGKKLVAANCRGELGSNSGHIIANKNQCLADGDGVDAALP